MCDGSITSGAPPIALSLNQYVIPTVPRDGIQIGNGQSAGTAGTAAASPPASSNPFLGKHLDLSA